MSESEWSVEFPVYDVEDQEQHLQSVKEEAQALLSKSLLDGDLGHGEGIHISGAIESASDADEVADIVNGYLAPDIADQEEESPDAGTPGD